MLYLLRHAQAGKGQSPDISRNLTPQGKDDAEKVGQWLNKQTHKPQSIICSTANRCTKTAQIAANKLNLDDSTIQYFDELYMCSATVLLQFIQETHRDIENLLLVSHNPGLERLAQQLAKTSLLAIADNSVALDPASLAIFKTNSPWSTLSPLSSELAELIHVDKLDITSSNLSLASL